MMNNVFICSFSGVVADLPKKRRTEDNVLAVLIKSPRVSTWDMSENAWLRRIIASLEKRGLIEAKDEPYPWHRYEATEEGKIHAL